MAIEFRCTNCGKLLQTGDELAGKKAKCPECQTILVIPAPGTQAPQPAAGHPAPHQGMPPSAGHPGPKVSTGNPFQSPQASGPAPGSIGPGAKLDMNDLFSTTWGVFKANLAMAIVLPLLIQLIMMVIAMPVYFVMILVVQATRNGFVFGLLYLMFLALITVASAVLFVGLLKAFLKMARGQPYAVGDLFAFGPEVGPFVLTYVLFTLMVSVGNAFCVVPGIFLASMFAPCFMLVLDRNVAVMDSFNQAKELTNGNKMTILVTFLLAGIGAAAITVCTCGLGGIVAGPFMWLLMVVMYLRITNQPIAIPTAPGAMPQA